MITKDQATYLLTNFKEQFPRKTSSFSISKHLLAYVLGEPNVSGIRFMYGIKDLSDPQVSIVLMPSSYDLISQNSKLPNLIIKKDGYFIHDGEEVTVENTWKMLFNYVKYEHQQNPEIPLKKIHRGDFWGINKLNDFINNPEIATLQFNIGYSPIECEFTKGIHPVLNGFDEENNSLNIFMDFTTPCPQNCDGEGDLSCILTGMVNAVAGNTDETELNIFREFREELWRSEKGYLVEMYYHTSPIIAAAINKHDNKDSIYKALYNNYLSPCLKAIEKNDSKEALNIYTNVFEYLQNEYA